MKELHFYLLRNVTSTIEGTPEAFRELAALLLKCADSPDGSYTMLPGYAHPVVRARSFTPTAVKPTCTCGATEQGAPWLIPEHAESCPAKGVEW